MRVVGRRAPWRARSGRGQSTVEFALVLPLVLFAAMAILQVAFVVRDQVAVVHAAREGARAASVEPDPRAASEAVHRTIPGAQVDVATRPRVGEPVRVDVHYRSATTLPLVGRLFPDPTLHASATMRVER